LSVDWNAETVAWIVLGISTLYLADRLVIWLVTRYRQGRPGRAGGAGDRSSGPIL
jgi:hypothetical protein